MGATEGTQAQQEGSPGAPWLARLRVKSLHCRFIMYFGM
jgi:hypothetical protein